MQNDNKIQNLINSSTILLQGYRNTLDGCWDILVHKMTVQEDNYKKPLTHSCLQPRRQNMNSMIIRPPVQLPKEKLVMAYNNISIYL